MPLDKNTVIVITGTTATGKSSLAIELCKKLEDKEIEAEIISADSVAVYRSFKIGTASPDLEEQKGIPHHLLHTEDPRINFTAGEFVRKAAAIIDDLHKNKKIPIIVGGSGFYLRALTHGMAFDHTEDKDKKKEINQFLMKELGEKSLPFLYEKMLKKDPDLRENIHPNDEYRIIRALEVMEVLGEKWSVLNKKAKKLPPRYPNSIFFFLQLDREELRERVIKRTQNMLKEGLLEEVEDLVKKDIPIQSKAFQSVGYRECLEYLEIIKSKPEEQKPISIKDLEEKIVRETMRLAKNQMTWSRNQVKNRNYLEIKEDYLKGILKHLDLDIE